MNICKILIQIFCNIVVIKIIGLQKMEGVIMNHNKGIHRNFSFKDSSKDVCIFSIYY